MKFQSLEDELKEDKKDPVKDLRTYPVKEYLKTTTRKDAVKKMMMDLFIGQSRTMEEWAIADKHINEGRC